MMQLWQTIEEFNTKHYYEWRTKYLIHLNTDDMDDNMSKWLQQMGAAVRSPHVSNFEGPKTFIHFMRISIKVLQD